MNERTMPPTRWSDPAFLDTLRATCDPQAEACVASLPASVNYSALFSTVKCGGDPLPASAPQPLRDFFAATLHLPCVEPDRVAFPDGVDHARLTRGRAVFLDHTAISSLVLLAKALPEGYAAPCLSIILNLSGNLEHHPWRRLMGVLQLVVDIFSEGAFELDGQAIATAQKVRLMHAGVRHFLAHGWSGYAEFTKSYGEPINLEDRLATIMGFSLLVITGMQSLGVGLSDQDAEDYYYTWRVFALMMAIRPPGEPGSGDWVPLTIAEAQEFYDAYAKRHYADAKDNPDGCLLAKQNLKMLDTLMPAKLRRFGLGRVPRFYMTMLIGADGCHRVGIKPAGRWPVTRLISSWVIRAWARVWVWVDRHGEFRTVHEEVCTLALQTMIKRSLDREMTFDIPYDLSEIRALATPRP